MMTHLLKYELLQYARNKILWIVILLISGLTLFSFYLGNDRVQQKHQVVEQLREADQRFYDEARLVLEQRVAGLIEITQWWQDPSNPLVIAAFGASGKHVILEPEPLSILAVGHADILPYYGKVRMSAMVTLRDNVFENPIAQLKGSFDFAFVLVWLIPLLIIALSYNLLSSEREMGTMKLLQSLPISEHQILVAKVLFRLFLVVFSVVLSVIFGLIIFQVDVFSLGVAELIIAIILYCVFWFMLCLVINLTSLSSATNAVVLFGFWVFFLLVIPSILNLMANAIHPLPSRATWVTEQRNLQQEVEAASFDMLADFYETNPREILGDDVPAFFDNWNRRFLMLDSIGVRENKALQRFEAPKFAQEAFINRFKILSPPMIMNHRLEKISGTHPNQLRKLYEKMEAFQKEWNNFFLPRFRTLDFLTLEDFDKIPVP